MFFAAALCVSVVLVMPVLLHVPTRLMMLVAVLISKPAAGWYKADLPFVGEYDLANVGRTPNVVSNDD